MGNAQTKSPSTRPAAVEGSPLRCVIDGELEPPTVSLGDWIRDCNTGSQVHEMVAASPDQVERAVAAAQRVHHTGVWADMPLHTKCEWLNRVADAMGRYEEQMGRADARETGVVCELTTIINSSLNGAFRSIAEGIEKAGLSKVRVRCVVARVQRCYCEVLCTCV